MAAEHQILSLSLRFLFEIIGSIRKMIESQDTANLPQEIQEQISRTKTAIMGLDFVEKQERKRFEYLFPDDADDYT